MDFLDPRKRRAHRQRLIIGYALMSVAIVLSAYLLVSSAGGFGIDTKTGDVIVNGLLFADSKPGGAAIYLNGNTNNATTSARMILPAGNYRLTLKKDGYRDWSRNFVLNEHTVVRYVYPFLFPVKLTPQPLKNYPVSPPLATASPDRHWLLVQIAGTATFDEYDTTDLKLTPKTLAVPASLLNGSLGQLKFVEWSTDNKNVLLEHIYPGGNEFIVFNRTSPLDSFNVNKKLSLNPTQVALRNKKVDQLYVYSAATGSLQLGDTSSGQLVPVLEHVLAFKPSGSNLILYVTDQQAKPGYVWSRIWDGEKTYPLYTFVAGSHYLIDMAQFQNDWYYAAGSDKAERINIYKNPLDGLRNTAVKKALPLTSFRNSGADTISFSTNTRFLETESAQSFGVYDFETQTSYHYIVDKPLSGDLHWMDGHRLIGLSGTSSFVMDYDSTNQQALVPAISGDEIFFSADFNHMLSLSATSGGYSLDNTDLRAGVDLPKQ